MLDIDLARLVGDGPGGEGVAEAVGVHLGDPGRAPETAEQLLEAVGLEPRVRIEAPVAGVDEERARGVAADGGVRRERLGAACGEGDHALLVPLAVPHVEAARREVTIEQVEADGFAAADAAVEQGQQQRPIAQAHRRDGIAGVEQLGDLFSAEGLDDAQGDLHVTQAAEGGVLEEARALPPGEETAPLAKVAVPGLASEMRGALEVGDHMRGADRAHVLRRAVLAQRPLEALERPAIGLQGARGLPLDPAVGEVERDQRGQGRHVPRHPVHGRSSARGSQVRPGLAGAPVFLAAFGTTIADDPNEISLAILEKPSGEHWFGTDGLGRDYFARG